MRARARGRARAGARGRAGATPIDPGVVRRRPRGLTKTFTVVRGEAPTHAHTRQPCSPRGRHEEVQEGPASLSLSHAGEGRG